MLGRGIGSYIAKALVANGATVYVIFFCMKMSSWGSNVNISDLFQKEGGVRSNCEWAHKSRTWKMSLHRGWYRQWHWHHKVGDQNVNIIPLLSFWVITFSLLVFWTYSLYTRCRLVAELSKREPVLHILVNNAGIFDYFDISPFKFRICSIDIVSVSVRYSIFYHFQVC